MQKDLTNMKIFLLTICFFTFYLEGSSQGYLHLKKGKIVSHFSKQCIKDSIQFKISDNENLLSLSIVDSAVLPLEIICDLNKKGKCIEETFKYNCDSCAKKSLNEWLSNRKINWHKIDSNKFISGMGKNLYLTIISGTTFSVKYLKPKEYVKIRQTFKSTKQID